MPKLNSEKNKVFIAGKNVLTEWDEKKAINKLRTIIKNYLELDNVSFLFGAGSSINLGSISIASIPKAFEDAIKKIATKKDVELTAHEEFLGMLKDLQGTESVKRNSEDAIDYSVELLLNYLIAIEFLQTSSKNLISLKYVKETIQVLKEELFKSCDIENLENNHVGLSDDQTLLIDKNKFFFHEKFTKKILQRPLNLRRSNIFTTNYDLAFDYAFDRLGVHYINGFTGFHKRTFKPETYDYDIFYPGTTTQGKVCRIEKVLKYYKIHGSLTWVQTDTASDNVYGIEEWPIQLVRNEKRFDNLMIYPSAAKKSYTLDFPYSELFRQFAATITQQQSVLVTFGYSFSDEHINDIIYQALTIPSFTLIIVDFKGTLNPEILRLNSLKDPRILILEGIQLGSWPYFVEQVLPDFIEENIHEKVAETLNALYEPANSTSNTTNDNVYAIGIDETPVPLQDKECSTVEDQPKDDLPF